MNYKNVFVLFFPCLLLVQSCSSHRKQVVYSGMAGGLATAYVSKEASPNKKSENANMLIGFAVGGLLSAYLGHYLYEDSDPTKDLKPVKKEDLNLGNNLKSLDSLFNNQPVVLPNGLDSGK